MLRINYNYVQYLLTYRNPCRIGEQDLNETLLTLLTQSKRREKKKSWHQKIWCLTNVPIAIVYWHLNANLRLVVCWHGLLGFI